MMSFLAKPKVVPMFVHIQKIINFNNKRKDTLVLVIDHTKIGFYTVKSIFYRIHIKLTVAANKYFTFVIEKTEVIYPWYTG